MSDLFNTTEANKETGVVYSFPKGIILDSSLAQNTRTYDGPISKSMWKTIQSLDSKYPDNFDWSVYDRLYEKFGNKQPRGSVVFKTGLKLLNYHPQCSKCHYSLEIDTYGRGCTHNCVYCYAKDQLTLRGYWNRPHPMPLDLSEIRKIFYTVFETDKKSKWRSILEQRVPIRIGSMSDSFMWMDTRLGVTREFLKILKFYKYPYIVFTRSDLIAHDNYIAALDPKLAAIQFSISGENEAITRKMEPGAPSVKRRFVALKKLSEAGFWTTVRINPLLPKYPDGYFTDRDSTLKRFSGEIPTLPLFDIDKPENFMSMMKEAKVPTVIAGFARLNQTSTSQLSKTTNVDLKQFFKPELRKSVGESHYTNSEIHHYYRTIREAAQKQGIRFTTCYIGNGIKDYYQYKDLWASKKDCCDALGNVSSFKKTSQDVSWEERHKHSSDKSYSLDSQKREAEMDAVFTGNESDLDSKANWDNEHNSASRIKWTNRTQQPTTQA